MMINNLHLEKPLFKTHVQSVLHYFLDLNGIGTNKWIQLFKCMQKVIRYCGKHYALQRRKRRNQCQQRLIALRNKGNLGTLDIDADDA